jgi:long-chain fatty acid transport protein
MNSSGLETRKLRRTTLLGSVRCSLALTLAAMFSLAGVGTAQAGGLYFPITGTPSGGVAGAGIGARANDASTALFNPAGMTRLDDHQFMFAAAPGKGNVKFDADANTPAGGGDGGQQGGFLPVVSSYYVHKLSDRTRLGLAVVSISGASLDPSSNWAGRNQLTSITLMTLTAVPTVAFRITDQISVGAGAAMTYAKLDWKLDAPGPFETRVKIDDADDFAVAPIVGLFYEPTSWVRFGFVYQGKTDLELGGDIELRTPMGRTASLDLDLPLAQAVRVNAVWEVSDLVALFFSARWEDWSVLDTTAVSIGGASEDVALNFKDTWGGGIGMEFYPAERWTFQTGLSYDSSALNDSDRTTALPIDRSIRFGVGVLHDYTEHTQLGFAFQYINLGKAKIDQATVSGSYEDNELFMFALNVNFSKLPWSGRAQF